MVSYIYLTVFVCRTSSSGKYTTSLMMCTLLCQSTVQGPAVSQRPKLNLNIQYVSQVIWICTKACRAEYPQIAEQQVVSIRTHPAERSPGTHGKKSGTSTPQFLCGSSLLLGCSHWESFSTGLSECISYNCNIILGTRASTKKRENSLSTKV